MTRDHDLEERLAFIGLKGESLAALKSLLPVIESAIGPSLDNFYSKIRKNPHTSSFFKDDAHVDMAKSRQVQHWREIGRGHFTSDYVERVSRVGLAHARIGLTPRWYISGYAMIVEQMIHAVLEQQWKSIQHKKSHPRQTAMELSAFIKAALLDMDYAISIYLDALEHERQKADTARKEEEQSRKIARQALARALNGLAEGDLETRLDERLPPSFKDMANDFNEAVERLRETLIKSHRTSEQIVDTVTSIAHSTHELSERTVQQAASLEQSSAALHQLTDSVHGASENIDNAAQVVAQVQSDANSSEKQMRNVAKVMGEIENSSNKIARIIGVIDDIAFQTNLLALNASVEAARAGESGKGFAVVAQEVRALAQRSADSASEIKALIKDSQDHVVNGVTVVGNADTALNKVIGRIGEINAIVGNIAMQAKEQSMGLSEVNTAVAQLDQITQQNAAMSETTLKQTKELDRRAKYMREEMGRFKLGHAGQAQNRRRAS